MLVYTVPTDKQSRRDSATPECPCGTPGWSAPSSGRLAGTSTCCQLNQRRRAVAIAGTGLTETSACHMSPIRDTASRRLSTSIHSTTLIPANQSIRPHIHNCRLTKTYIYVNMADKMYAYNGTFYVSRTNYFRGDFA